MTTTTPDAVEALTNARNSVNSVLVYGDSVRTAEEVSRSIIEQLERNGFTITRAEPAMSEEEILLHCQSLAMKFADDNLREEFEQAAFELAKKYRG